MTDTDNKTRHENHIGFSHHYTKLHGQTRGQLVHTAFVTIDENTPQETIQYDTDGVFPLPHGRYLRLVFVGDKGIPFTTYRTPTDEHIDRFCNHYGEWFAFNFKTTTADGCASPSESTHAKNNDWNVAFDEAEFGWLHRDTQTEFWKFRFDFIHTLSDDEHRRVADAMTTAASREIAMIASERTELKPNGRE